MPRSRTPSLRHQLEGPGLRSLLDTGDFGCWHAAVSATLGHHRSELLAPRSPFHARFRGGQLGGFGVLHLQGRGRLRLCREQRQDGVLWMPLRGMSQERINGRDWLAEPGSALLFHPGDAMDGETGEELEGISLLIPASLLAGLPRPEVPLLAMGPLAQQVLSTARQLAAAAAQQPSGAEHLADRFSAALRDWTATWGDPAPRERITARRRRQSVQRAREWMGLHLSRRFGVVELSRALAISPRQLQYSFQQELGRSPMAEAKRLRLRHLRGLLLDPAQDHRSVAELMLASGLVASGVSAADYRYWCGESPRRTRQRRA